MRKISIRPPKAKFHRLECLRGAAALYVLLHHISSSYLHLQKTIIGTFFRFGQEAVVVFFVLSGFVIAYSMERAEGSDWRGYFLKRLRRIYPIFLFSLLLAWLFPVQESTFRNPSLPWWLAGNVLMLQDVASKPGVWVEPFFGNSPLWSLSYEWLYYMLFFPIRRFVRAENRKWVVLALSVGGILMNRVWPNPFGNILALFPVWWTGVEFASSFLKRGKVIPREVVTQALVLVVPLLMFAGLVWMEVKMGNHPSMIVYPLVQFRMLFDVLVLMAVFFLWQRIHFKGFDPLFRVFGLVAPISYALYVFHYPLIGGLRLFSNEAWFWPDLICRVALVFVVSWILERPVQKWINARTNRWITR